MKPRSRSKADFLPPSCGQVVIAAGFRLFSRHPGTLRPPLSLVFFVQGMEAAVKFSTGEKTAVGGNLASVEFQLKSAVEIDLQRGLFAFTRRVT